MNFTNMSVTESKLWKLYFDQEFITEMDKEPLANPQNCIYAKLFHVKIDLFRYGLGSCSLSPTIKMSLHFFFFFVYFFFFFFFIFCLLCFLFPHCEKYFDHQKVSQGIKISI